MYKFSAEGEGFKIHVWNKKANFGLGDKTAILARNLLRLEVLGSQCTNSKSLADFIGTCGKKGGIIPQNRSVNLLQLFG
ncbi:UNVERIFIED_CONTAM: hypothetical protein NCL1_37786 [Trichonephila clavipes]